MSNITILNVGRPNFSCEFRSTRFSSILLKTIILLKLANLQVRLFEILSSESPQKTTYKTLLRLPWLFKRFLSYCSFKMGKSPKIAQISWALV